MSGVNLILVAVAFAVIYQVRKELLASIQAMQSEIDGLKRQGSAPGPAAPPGE